MGTVSLYRHKYQESREQLLENQMVNLSVNQSSLCGICPGTIVTEHINPWLTKWNETRIMAYGHDGTMVAGLRYLWINFGQNLNLTGHGRNLTTVFRIYFLHKLFVDKLPLHSHWQLGGRLGKLQNEATDLPVV